MCSLSHIWSEKLPAKDAYHFTVVHALASEGWTTTDEQVALVLENRRLWIDIEATKIAESIVILVEVKGFEDLLSPVTYLAAAVGKYILYTAILETLGIATPLYMAVPVDAYNGILSEEIGQIALKKAAIKLIVFDPETEEILQWLH